MKRIFTMKMALMSALFSLLMTQTNGQIILSENFNNGFPSSWSTIDGDGANYNAGLSWTPITGDWRVVEDYDSTGVGDSVAVSSSWYDPVVQADDWMITPQITLGANTEISYDEKAQDPSYPDGYELLISTTTPDPAGFGANSPIYSVNVAANPGVRQTFNLSNYAGLQVYIAWHNNSTDQFVLVMDNVLIENVVTTDITANNIENMNVSLYPNPVNNDLIVNVTLAAVADVHLNIVSSTGQIVYNETVAGIENLRKAINTEDWTKGIYHLQVTTAEGVKTERFVKM